MSGGFQKVLRDAVLAAAAACFAAAAWGGELSPQLRAIAKDKAATQTVPVIITLADRVDANEYQSGNNNRDDNRDGRLVRALKDKAANTQGPLQAFVRGSGATDLHELWVINSVAVSLPASWLDAVAHFPGVESVRPDSLALAPSTMAAAAAPREWNVDAVKAPDVWTLGFDGAGVIVASMDTGVDAAHPDLAAKWRGGSNSWFDPHGQHATPYDASGHGTQTMAVMVGGSAGGTAIGVAPGARWIAAKLYNDAGQATYSQIHQTFQWLLDPDNNPATPDTPDVVNLSWGLVGTSGTCITEFDTDIRLLKAAGIAVAVAAGNDGPAASTSLSPANNASSFSVGSVDSALAVSSFSARGPSACTGGIFPNVVAPGTNIYTADLSFGGLPFYITVSGTSFAAPHAAGTMALLLNAFPAATVPDVEAAIKAGATDLGVPGPDYSAGYGLINALSAYNMLLAGAGSPPTITSTPVTTATQGVAYTYTVTATDASGSALTYALDVAPSGMTIGATTGVITWTPTNAQVGPNAVTVRVTNARGLAARQSFTVTVANVNDAPIAVNDAYTMNQAATLTVAAPGVLANDSDPDRDPITAVMVSAPVHGTLSLAANGSFTYTPVATYSGSDTFTYQAFDGTLASNIATVTITIAPVNGPPVAGTDAYSILQDTTLSVAAPGVLANDSDPEAAPLTAVLATAPTRGTLTLNANGSFTYKPNPGLTGADSFTYRAFDGAVYSAPATVSITVTANRAPVAVNDSATAKVRGSGSYTPVVINVVANDTDADGNLDPSTVTITTATNKGGTVAVNANGTVSYTPKAGYRGAETFRYKVRDKLGAQSNAATVTVTVQ
jgi:bacillopeptidase F